MSTKKAGKGLVHHDLRNFHFLHVYQISTRAAFSKKKWPVFILSIGFCNIFCDARGVIPSLIGRFVPTGTIFAAFSWKTLDKSCVFLSPLRRFLWIGSDEAGLLLWSRAPFGAFLGGWRKKFSASPAYPKMTRGAHPRSRCPRRQGDIFYKEESQMRNLKRALSLAMASEHAI